MLMIAAITKRRIVLVALGLLTIVPTGCADMPAWVPFQGPRSDVLPGVVTPAEKISQLRKLSDDAGKSDQPTKHKVVEQLVTSIRTETDPLIRVEIIRTLGNYPDPAADQVLTSALSDPDSDVRITACDSWGKRGDVQAAALLTPLLASDVNRDVRLAAARALGKVKNQQAIDALGDVLTDSDPAMQYRAVLSLREITGQDLGSNVDHWRQYVKDGQAKPAQPASMADRFKRMF
jgi:HEAT repeat protein